MKAAVKTKNTAKAEAAQKKTATKAKTAKKTAKKTETKTKKGTAPVTATNAVKKESKAEVVKEVKAETPKEVKAETPKEVTPVEPETKEEAKQLEGEELQAAIEKQTNSMRVVISRSTHGKMQQRMVGKRKFKNAYGHYYGTIGSKIDRLIENGAFTKKQIETYSGTKMSKVNSHIAHLRRDVKKVVIFDEKKRVLFG